MDIKDYISSGIIEAYVLGIATEEEVSILECVRNKHPEVEQAIREAEMLLEDTATIQATQPPAAWRDSIWASLEASQAAEKGVSNQIPPVTPGDTVQTPVVPANATIAPAAEAAPAPRIVQFSPWAIAATALLIGSVAANVYLYQQEQSTTDKLAQLENKNQTNELLLSSAYRSLDMLQNPAVNMVALAGVEAHPQLHAVVLWNKAENEVYLMADRLPQAPAGKQYQLWALLDGQPIDAGVVPLAKEDMMHAMKPIANAQAFAITLEDEGGKPTPDLAELQVMGEI